jgi:hypothetical protein
VKAVWYDRQGPAREVLLYGELPMQQPGPGEVRVRLHACAVNPADANRRAGQMHGMEFPRIVPNSDGAELSTLWEWASTFASSACASGSVLASVAVPSGRQPSTFAFPGN